MSRLFDLLIARPKSSLLMTLIFTALISLGAARLRIDFSPEQVYVGQDDAVAFSEQHKQMFRFEDSIVLVVLESTDGRSLIREDCLRWLQKFAAKSRQLDGVREVTSVVTLERPRIRLRGEQKVEWMPLLPEAFYGDTALLTQQLARLPLLNDTLVSTDRQLVMTLVDLNPQDRTIAKATVRVDAIHKIIDELTLPDGTTTFTSGVPAIRVDVIRSIVKDQVQMVPVCSALFLMVSLMMFRSITVTALSLFSALAAVAITLGLMGWFGMTFTVMSNVIPALLLIIGAANNVHILSRFQVEVRQSGNDLKTCAKSTMMEMSKTCFLTLATTAIGFGSLYLARADMLKSLALQSAMGMACCYLGQMAVMPQTLILCGPALSRRRSDTAAIRVKSPSNADSVILNPESPVHRVSAFRLQGIWRRFGKAVSDYSVIIVAFHLLLAGWTLYSCRNLTINSYMFETYDGDHPTMLAVQKMDERMSGLISLELQLRASQSSRFFDADMASALAGVRDAIKRDDRVTFYRDYIEFLSVFDHGRPLAEDPAAAAASLQRVRLVLRQLGERDVTSAFLGRGQPVARVMMRIRDVGSAGMQDLIDNLKVILKKEIPPDIEFRITGDAYLHAVCMDAFVRDLFSSLVAATGVIFLLITLLFRSLRIGLISAVPNIFPLIMTLGYMNLRGYELTAGNVIVFAISLGIAVDDTIHFLARYRDARKVSSNIDAIESTLTSSGRAIVLTSVLVVSGLSILVFSDFVPTRRFAELTAVTICSALPGDVILLPALLKLFGGRSLKKRG